MTKVEKDKKYIAQCNAFYGFPQHDQDILDEIHSDAELLKLYQNDAHFYAAIHVSIARKLSIKEALIYALKIGYDAKSKLQKNFNDYVMINPAPYRLK